MTVGHCRRGRRPSFDAAAELENRQQVLTAVTADAEAMAAYRGRRDPRYQNQ